MKRRTQQQRKASLALKRERHAAGLCSQCGAPSGKFWRCREHRLAGALKYAARVTARKHVQ